MRCDCGLCTEFNLKENILEVYEHTFLMFNRYPYLPGHLMLVPKRPVARLSELTQPEKLELIDRLGYVQDKLTGCLKQFGVDSTNLGVNTGSHGGGSIPYHLHIHIVPRRINDTNFMHTCNFSGIGYLKEPMSSNRIYHEYRSAIEEAWLKLKK